MILILYPPSGFVTPALVQIGNQSFKMMYYLWILPSEAISAVIIVIIDDVKQGAGLCANGLWVFAELPQQ